MTTARKITLACLIAAMAVAIMAITGCKQTSDSTDTADDCMSKFETAVNTKSYGDIGALLSESATKYSQATASSYWETYFYPNIDFTYTITGTTATGYLASKTHTFVFELGKNSDGDYRIESVTRDGTTIFE